MERVLKLHYPDGHPYWNADEYKIELNGNEFDLDKIPLSELPKYAQFYCGRLSNERRRIILKDDGLYYQLCSDSSHGKNDYEKPFKVLDKSEYDKVEFVGVKKGMPQSIIDDLKDMGKM